MPQPSLHSRRRRGIEEEVAMKKTVEARTRLVPLGVASEQTKGAEGLFTDDVLKSRITGGLTAE
jgi:hypothetical protein